MKQRAGAEANPIKEVLEALLAKGWSVPAIANHLGARRSTIYRWLNGEERPNYEVAIVYFLEKKLLPRKRVPRQ